MVEDDEDAAHLASTARRFLDEAFTGLTADCVIPTPAAHPFISVGTDYFGPTIMGLDTYGAFASAIERVAPKRFARELYTGEHAVNYVFSFLEAVVARAGRERDYRSDGESATRCIDEMLGVLRADEHDVYCCRVLCHFSTPDGSPVTVGDITVVPEGPEGPESLEQGIRAWIPAATPRFHRDWPRTWGPPHSVATIRGTALNQGDVYRTMQQLAARLDHFLLAAYLYGGWTIVPGYEVQGAGTLISRPRPQLRVFQDSHLELLAQRPGTLTPWAARSIAAIEQLVLSADVKRDGMATTSIDTALSNLQRSYLADGSFTAIVDLATALEAVLISGDKDTDALTAKLRSRAAALLATETDSGRDIHNDINKLYALRSKLVHGGQVKHKDLEKMVSALSTTPPSAAGRLGVGMEYAVDRIRDLVRRAILARLCLSTGEQPRWPLNGAGVAVDAELADNSTRAAWRSAWRQQLEDIGAASAAEPAEPLRDRLALP